MVGGALGTENPTLSLSFHVAVPPGRWPSFNEMNALIAKHGYRLVVVPQDGQSADDPMAEADGFLGFHAIFRGKVQEMECYHAVFADDTAEETNEFLQEIGSDHRVRSGAHEWAYGYGHSIEPEFLAPYYILAGILVVECGGYGYEGQGPSFGAEDYGRAELAEADRQIAILNRPPPPRKLLGLVPINFWTIFGGLTLLLLLAECVDNNIYNFTGTQN